MQKDHGLTVEFSAEDATRTEHDYLFDVYDAVVDAGADFFKCSRHCWSIDSSYN